MCDVGNTDDFSNVVVRLEQTAAGEIVDPAGVPVKLNRGCFISMSGTSPRCIVKICKAGAYGSEGALRTAAARRVPAPRDV